ncbi:hypothetical protein [Candidatus Harpocratesius sp.]
MVDICVYMHDAKLFYLITHKFRNEEIPFIALDNLSKIHRSLRVLITTKEELKETSAIIRSSIHILEVSQEDSPDQILLKALQYSKNLISFHTLTIGIDPGRRMTGIAVFFDGVFVYSREISNLAELRQYIITSFQTFPTKRKIIKIGDGVIELTDEYINHLIKGEKIKNQSDIFIVNETSTSKRPYNGINKVSSKHEKAAMFIGRRTGHLFSSKKNKRKSRLTD